MTDQTKPWRLLHNGRRFNLTEPTFPEGDTALMIEVLIPTLATPRFGGHTPYYTCGHHALLVHWLALLSGAGPLVQLAALVHDLQEAYTGDISGPIKRMFPDIKSFENEVQFPFLWALGFDGPSGQAVPALAAVKEYDKEAEQIERDAFLPDHPDWPTQGDGRLAKELVKKDQEATARKILGAFVHLKQQMGWASDLKADPVV